MDKLYFTSSSGIRNVPDSIFSEFALTQKEAYTKFVSTQMTYRELEKELAKIGIDSIRFFGGWSDNQSVLFDYKECLIHVSLSAGHLYIGTCGVDSERIMQLVESIVPKIETDDSSIGVTFWSNSKHGPIERRRSITVPNMEDIADNYSRNTLESVMELHGLETPEGRGKLILFHGQPGTGKTFCIRALAKKWSKWCNIEYIVDPEELFGSADYLMSMLLSDDDDRDTDKWRLFIMEDVDEFLTIDAKTRQGQSMARLLNVSEGLIGQGIKILILMTTNEPVTKLHDAIKRPGRCLADVEFGTLKHDEVVRWCEKHGAKEVPVGERTLAQLYNETGVAKIESTAPLRQMGFNRGVKPRG